MNEEEIFTGLPEEKSTPALAPKTQLSASCCAKREKVEKNIVTRSRKALFMVLLSKFDKYNTISVFKGKNQICRLNLFLRCYEFN
jgi:hypothetical protein